MVTDTNLLEQAGVRSAKVNGITGIIFYQSNTCTKRKFLCRKLDQIYFRLSLLDLFLLTRDYPGN